MSSTVYTLDTVRLKNEAFRRKSIRSVMFNEFTFDQLKTE